MSNTNYSTWTRPTGGNSRRLVLFTATTLLIFGCQDAKHFGRDGGVSKVADSSSDGVLDAPGGAPTNDGSSADILHPPTGSGGGTPTSSGGASATGGAAGGSGSGGKTGGGGAAVDAGADSSSGGNGGRASSGDAGLGGAGGGLVVCSSDVADCNHNPTDGCEASLDSTANCGRCGNNCMGPNGTSACVNRQCAPLTCSAGFADCNANRIDGCEASLDADNRCGDCDRKCISPMPTCALVGSTRSCTNPVLTLSDQRIQVPCVDVNSSKELCASVATSASGCPVAGKVATRSLTVGGRIGVVYNVTLRIRGVVEPKVYAGGRGPGNHFYIGGTPVDSNYNTYRMVVSSPPQTYYFNYDEARGESHVVFTLDHTKTIQIAGGATIKLEWTDPDCAMVKNCQSFATDACEPYVVPGTPPAPLGYNGQFIHLEVTAVANAS